MDSSENPFTSVFSKEDDTNKPIAILVPDSAAGPSVRLGDFHRSGVVPPFSRTRNSLKSNGNPW